MNGTAGSILHPRRGSWSCATGPAWREGLGPRTVGKGMSKELGGGSQQVPAELVRREPGDSEAEALGRFSRPVRGASWG